MLKVKTLDRAAFDDACKRLNMQASGFRPDLIVGVATGGVYVAERMFVSIPHVSVTQQRPTTEVKEDIPVLMRMIRRLPLPVRDLLRIAESLVLSFRQNDTVVPDIDDGTRRAIVSSRRILVVDDAIDSGSTIAGVLDAISDCFANLDKPEIRVAVITVTTRRPIVRPDYFIYDNGTLVRFPWSKDNTP